MPAPSVTLRTTTAADVAALFEMQADPESNHLAGTKPRTREVFAAVWEKILQDVKVHACVIESGGAVVGSISMFQAEGHDCVGYWIDRAHWGRGIASQALAQFLVREPRRPLRATASTANAASLRILERCGFRRVGTRMGEETDRYLAREVAEFVLE